MERLTEWYDDGEHKGVMVKEQFGDKVLRTLFDELDEGYVGMCQLKAYEDTGLTPSEIMELKERDTAKVPEPAPLGMDGMVCPACGKKALPWDRFCGECGQRFWEDE
jgi:hypothetical protein|uniref:Thaumarchaeal output domain 1 n=1 Tax=Siphoviridae sp. ctYcY12 TaxID=2825550 RepID=A0A8S5TTZ7_9CAUD|nr:MAG TPA: Thaumarchaeal output domain 1 [Siphoviridae sp. ctYcY12]